MARRRSQSSWRQTRLAPHPSALLVCAGYPGPARSIRPRLHPRRRAATGRASNGAENRRVNPSSDGCTYEQALERHCRRARDETYWREMGAPMRWPDGDTRHIRSDVVVWTRARTATRGADSGSRAEYSGVGARHRPEGSESCSEFDVRSQQHGLEVAEIAYQRGSRSVLTRRPSAGPGESFSSDRSDIEKNNPARARRARAPLRTDRTGPLSGARGLLILQVRRILASPLAANGVVTTARLTTTDGINDDGFDRAAWRRRESALEAGRLPLCSRAAAPGMDVRVHQSDEPARSAGCSLL